MSAGELEREMYVVVDGTPTDAPIHDAILADARPLPPDLVEHFRREAEQRAEARRRRKAKAAALVEERRRRRTKGQNAT